MKFTGERYIPTEQGQIRLEHYHRYAIVLEIAKDKDVLDVACGEGYGSFLLSDVAKSVVGADISDEAVNHAINNYRKRNLSFKQGSAIKLEFPDETFDLVVSFETIEHLSEQAEMIAEIRRVLRHDGVLVISSPNRPVYSEESGEQNEFHVKELDFNEFDELLKAQFPAINYYGQRLLMGSVIQHLEGGGNFYQAWCDDGNTLKPTTSKLIDPVYFVAICSGKEVNLPKIDMSLLFPEKLDLIKHYVSFAKWAIELDHISSEREQQISVLNELLRRLNAKIIEYERIIAEHNATVTALEMQVKNLNILSEQLTADRKKIQAKLEASQTRFREVLQSTSWRITLPLRESRRWIAEPKKQTIKYANAGFVLIKKAYRSLPLSEETKNRHIRKLEKYIPKQEPIRKKQPNIIPLLTLPTLKQVMSKKYTNPVDYAKSIELPEAQSPKVSVIIPVYGKVEYTLHCLASIAANLPQTAFEVIVVDDCSTDDSYAVLAQVKGLHLLKNEKNQGFIRTCNAGTKVARGEYLYFLNNDTEVTPNWLDSLYCTFQDFPGTGYAGSKLIYPDGKLQEAGGIIWQDGSAWNFGRFQDPQLPVYNYAREVDYCSGASIMVPKALFDEIGGFDEHYLPAYGEDSDLALKIRDKGYRVIYQPQSTVIHYEGITSGTDTSQGVKAYQIENGKKLYERWKERLKNHQQAGKDADNAKDRRAKRRVLVIDHCTPTPDHDAGSVTVFNLLLLLREMDFQVTFIPEDNFLYLPDYTAGLQSNGIEVIYTPYCTTVEQHVTEFGHRYDLVFLFRPGVIRLHLELIRAQCPNAKVLYHTVDLHYLRMEREAELQSDQTKLEAAQAMKQRELSAIRAADAAIVHSTTELEILRPELPDAKLHVFPLIVDVRGAGKTFSARKDIVFVGGYQHTPNIDAVLNFVKEIMPSLRLRLPGVRFFAAGSKPPLELQELAAEDVIITGFIEDLNPFLDNIRISVAPLRYGAGIKGKIGTAMAVGLPVVASPLAAEGMALTDGENILIADGADAFVETIAQLYKDEALWNRISQSGLKYAESAWGAEAAWNTLHTILADISIPTARGAYPLSLYSESNAALKKINNNKPSQLVPIRTVMNRNEYDLALASDEIEQIRWIEKSLLESAAKTTAFNLSGYCVPCDQKVAFLVDMESGGQDQGEFWIPNWRERLECPRCKMNNRQRLIATLIKQELESPTKKNIYLMEQVTPIYSWAAETFKNHDITGSEYLGYEYESGASINGIRHEDVEKLSFLDGTLDLIVSNDVFEHVPNPAKAFAECARVLKSGGVMLATIPFHGEKDESVVRAKINQGQLEYLLSPLYHGNPVSADGSLVFTDFGWDVLKEMQTAGFSDVSVEIYASAELGHLGGGQLVFRAEKGQGIL